MTGSARANEPRLLYGFPETIRRAVEKGKPVTPRAETAGARAAVHW